MTFEISFSGQYLIVEYKIKRGWQGGGGSEDHQTTQIGSLSHTHAHHYF